MTTENELINSAAHKLDSSDYVIDSTLNIASPNPVQNGIITVALNGKLDSTAYVVDTTLDTASSNPIENSAIATAINGKLSTDASNLTTAGQQVFDGQWVNSVYQIMASTDITNTTSDAVSTDISFANYLPNDNYTYAVMLTWWLNATAPSNISECNSATAWCTHNITGSSYVHAYLGRATNAKLSSTVYIGQASLGNTILIIPPAYRKIILRIGSGSKGSFADLSATMYRRIGTNS